MSSERVRLESISPASWEHPTDRAALSVVKQVPGISDFLKALGSLTSDRSLRLLFLGSSIRVTPLQFPHLHQTLLDACRILDITEIPQLFVTGNPMMNAMAIGFESPFLVVHSALVKELSTEEMLAVLGHELAHIKANHMVYRTAIWILTNLSFRLTQADDLVRIPILLALKDWERKSELSCDRAGLLTCQDPEAASRVLLKMASGGLIDQTDLSELSKQAEEYDTSGDLLDSLYKFTNVMASSHPPLVSRYRELNRWAQSPEYSSILAGNYIKVGEEPEPSANAQKAWDSWKDDLKNSGDAGSRLVGQVVQEIEKTGREIEKFFKDFLR